MNKIISGYAVNNILVVKNYDIIISFAQVISNLGSLLAEAYI